MRVEYECTPAEWKEARRAVVREVGRGAGWWRALIPFAFVLVVLVLILSTRNISARGLATGFVRVLPVYGVAFVLAFVLLFIWQRMSNGNEDSPPDKLAKLELGEEGVRIVARGTREQLDWEGLDRHLETPNLFILLRRETAGPVFYPVPKRVLANRESEFRDALRARAGKAAPQPPPQSTAGRGDTLNVRFFFRFPDFLDATLASWRTRAVMLLPAVAIAAGTAFAFLPGAAPAVRSPREILVAVVPWVVGPVVVFPLLFAGYAWLMNPFRRDEEDLTFGPSGVAARLSGGRVQVGWEQIEWFKETPRSYIVWGRGVPWPAYLLVPKRVLSAEQDRRLADLLDARSKRTTWFFR